MNNQREKGPYSGLDLFHSFTFIISCLCESRGFSFFFLFLFLFSDFLLPDLVLPVDSFWQGDHIGYVFPDDF